MMFVQWLNALDELLYELISWFLFFPLTIARIVRRPLAMMRYAEDQLELEPARQYRATVSPPILLILATVLSEAFGLAVDGTNNIVRNRHGLASIVTDNTTLLLLKLVLFALFALILSAIKVHRSDVDLDRDSLKAPFYAQCFAISPFALLLGVGTIAIFHARFFIAVVGVFSLLFAFVFYGVVQVRWFRAELGCSTGRAIVDAVLGLAASVAILFFVGYLFTQ